MKFFFPVLLSLGFASCSHAVDWRTASRKSANLAPLPQDEPQAVVQVYAARTYGWRKYFAVHSWIATKDKNADSYTTYQVTSWSLNSGGSAVAVANDIPDRYWYGAEPDLLFDLRGAKAETAIANIRALVKAYYYHDQYVIWPGPNSNSFIAYLIRHTPGMHVELPPTAIGKDWIDQGSLAGWSQTGTGVQCSFFGLLGFTVALEEGVEVNILGMAFGVDLWRPAIKLPFIGRVGFPDGPLF
jgi:hypothetical protein